MVTTPRYYEWRRAAELYGCGGGDYTELLLAVQGCRCTSPAARARMLCAAVGGAELQGFVACGYGD